MFLATLTSDGGKIDHKRAAGGLVSCSTTKHTSTYERRKNMIFSAMLASSNLLYGTKTIMEELHSARLAAAGACTDRASMMCTCAMLLLSFRSANQKKCNVLICEKR